MKADKNNKIFRYHFRERKWNRLLGKPETMLCFQLKNARFMNKIKFELFKFYGLIQFVKNITFGVTHRYGCCLQTLFKFTHLNVGCESSVMEVSEADEELTPRSEIQPLGNFYLSLLPQSIKGVLFRSSIRSYPNWLDNNSI